MFRNLMKRGNVDPFDVVDAAVGSKGFKVCANYFLHHMVTKVKVKNYILTDHTGEYRGPAPNPGGPATAGCVRRLPRDHGQTSGPEGGEETQPFYHE